MSNWVRSILCDAAAISSYWLLQIASFFFFWASSRQETFFFFFYSCWRRFVLLWKCVVVRQQYCDSSQHWSQHNRDSLSSVAAVYGTWAYVKPLNVSRSEHIYHPPLDYVFTPFVPRQQPARLKLISSFSFNCRVLVNVPSGLWANESHLRFDHMPDSEPHWSSSHALLDDKTWDSRNNVKVIFSVSARLRKAASPTKCVSAAAFTCMWTYECVICSLNGFIRHDCEPIATWLYTTVHYCVFATLLFL